MNHNTMNDNGLDLFNENLNKSLHEAFAKKLSNKVLDEDNNQNNQKGWKKHLLDAKKLLITVVLLSFFKIVVNQLSPTWCHFVNSWNYVSYRLSSHSHPISDIYSDGLSSANEQIKLDTFNNEKVQEPNNKLESERRNQSELSSIISSDQLPSEIDFISTSHGFSSSDIAKIIDVNGVIQSYSTSIDGSDLITIDHPTSRSLTIVLHNNYILKIQV